MNIWLLESEVKRKIELAEERGFVPTAEQSLAVEKCFADGVVDWNGTPLVSMVGDKAQINIRGALTPSPDIMAFIFGGGNTTYAEIADALTMADANPEVREIVLDIDSPGGHMKGFHGLMDHMRQIETPITAKSSGLVASAAYGIASQANSIEAANKGVLFGSVGVLISDWVSENEVTVTSTNAPEKAPDLRTEEGVAMVRERLDKMHTLFAGIIAEGRNTTLETVNANFGRGAVLLAEEAKERGMIDCVGNCSSTIEATISTPFEAKHLTLDEFKASHPEIYSQAVETGKEEGAKSERDRVSAHLTMGEACGDMSIAIEAIEKGEEMTQLLTAKYNAAGMNKRDQDERAEDDDSTGATDGDLDSSKGDAKTDSELLEDKTMKIFDQLTGKEGDK